MQRCLWRANVRHLWSGLELTSISYTPPTQTCLEDLLCHGHHSVSEGGYAVHRPLGLGALLPQCKASHGVEDVCGGEFEMNCGAVGVIDDCRQEGFLSCGHDQQGAAECYGRDRHPTGS